MHFPMETLAISAGILALTAGPALAGKIQTPPFYGNAYVQCDVFYSGSGRGVPVTIQILRPYGPMRTETRKLGPQNRIAGVEWNGCDGSHTCRPVACVFTFSVPAADISASGTTQNSDGTILTISAK